MPETQELLVVGADGSPASDRALEWALDEARRRGGTVRVVTAFGAVQHGGTLDEPTVARQAREAAERVQARGCTASLLAGVWVSAGSYQAKPSCSRKRYAP